MKRHVIECSLTALLLMISIYNAIMLQWPAASYFLVFAALVDFDDWLHKGGTSA